MNIGRSHIVRYYLASILKLTCKKKKMNIICLNYDFLRKISYMLIMAQPPLIYKAKGLVYDFLITK